jgi:hypothetical protein
LKHDTGPDSTMQNRKGFPLIVLRTIDHSGPVRIGPVRSGKISLQSRCKVNCIFNIQYFLTIKNAKLNSRYFQVSYLFGNFKNNHAWEVTFLFILKELLNFYTFQMRETKKDCKNTLRPLKLQLHKAPH